MAKTLGDISTIKEHCDRLGLDSKRDIGYRDQYKLADSLKVSGELDLSLYIETLANPTELRDLLINFIYE